MSKNFTLKRQFLISLLSLILAVVMFSGTTFAWFSNILEIGGNNVVTGTLKMDLLHKSGEDWISLKKNPDHPVFDYEKWEPGYTQLETLKLQNAGTLAMRYQLLIGVADETALLGENGENIAEVIDVYVSFNDEPGATSAADLLDTEKWLKMGSLKSVLSQRYLVSGKLYADLAGYEGTPIEQQSVGAQELPFHLALHMREDAKNEYQLLSPGDITFSLYASQLAYEADSFDPNYDRLSGSMIYFDDGKEHSYSGVVVFDEDSAFTHVISATGSGTEVSINGGYYNANTQDGAVQATNGAVVNIYGGSFNGAGGEEGRNEQTLISADNGGKVNIYGGTFSATDAELLESTDAITVYGGTFVDWNPADNNGVNHCAEGTAMKVKIEDGKTVYEVVPVENVFVEDASGNLNIDGDTIVMNSALCQKFDATSPYTVDGHGHTVTINAFEGNNFNEWDESETRPVMSTMFSSDNNSLVTVKNLTMAGQMNPIFVGHYKNTGNKSTFTSILDNFNVVGAEFAPGSNPFAMALICYGKVTFKNCTIAGNKLVDLERYEGYPMYDVAATNNSSLFIESGTKIGSIYMWEHAAITVDDGGYVNHIQASGITYVSALNGVTVNSGGHVGLMEVEQTVGASYKLRVTIKSGATVDVLDLTKAKNVTAITIEEGATVKAITANGMRYASVADWVAGTPIS